MRLDDDDDEEELEEADDEAPRLFTCLVDGDEALLAVVVAEVVAVETPEVEQDDETASDELDEMPDELVVPDVEEMADEVELVGDTLQGGWGGSTWPPTM